MVEIVVFEKGVVTFSCDLEKTFVFVKIVEHYKLSDSCVDLNIP